jgi:hypothetical protein
VSNAMLSYQGRIPPGWVRGSGPLSPPYNERHWEEPGWPEADWGYFNDARSVTIEWIGLVRAPGLREVHIGPRVER